MDKLSQDKQGHNRLNQHLDDILEICRLPTTVNTLIHKGDSEMAMRLIQHFNAEIFDAESDLLVLVKKEVDILELKIQQKLNIEIEEGREIKGEVRLLLGDSPTPDEVQEYIHKKYKVRKDLLKQNLQKILFSKLYNNSKENSQVRE